MRGNQLNASVAQRDICSKIMFIDRLAGDMQGNVQSWPLWLSKTESKVPWSEPRQWQFLSTFIIEAVPKFRESSNARLDDSNDDHNTTFLEAIHMKPNYHFSYDRATCN